MYMYRPKRKLGTVCRVSYLSIGIRFACIRFSHPYTGIGLPAESAAR
jgi:hypothetical protein